MKGKKIIKAMVVMFITMTSLTSVKAADTNVTFDGNAQDFIFIDGSQDLFDNFKNIMPGEICNQDIILENDDYQELRFYLSTEVLDSLDTDTSRLGVYKISIMNNNEVFYRGTLDSLAKLSSGRMKDDTLLATLKQGETTKVTMTLEVDGDSMDNTYQNREGLVQFNFSVEKLDEEKKIVEVLKTIYNHISTGDNQMIAPLVILAIGAGIVFVVLLKKKKDKEGNKHEKNK